MRKIYLIVYSSPLFPAHWSLWVPSEENSSLGKRIHVTGDVKNGFEHEFVRGYDRKEDSRSQVIVFLADVDDSHIVDTLEPATDTNAVDDLERVALTVPAPHPSLRTSGNNIKTSGRITVRNCQTWLHEYVEALVKADIVPSSTIEVVEGAPRN